MTPVFVTWRLHGSLPRSHAAEAARIRSGEQFVRWDRLLDSAETGPLWLEDPGVAEIVEGVLRTEAAVMGRFELHCWVVMPNHVHALLTPCVPVAELTRCVKGRSGMLANRALGRRGLPFWQDENYVRPVTAAEFDRVARYVGGQARGLRRPHGPH